MAVSGRILILSIIVITAVATLFCIIGLATKGWSSLAPNGIFCNGCPTSTAALSVISFILLIVSILVLVVQLLNRLNGVLRFIPTVILFITTMFLLGTFTSFLSSTVGYSFNLMVAAHFFTYVALAISAYTLGQIDASSNTVN